jgi:hypothetical protein
MIAIYGVLMISIIFIMPQSNTKRGSGRTYCNAYKLSYNQVKPTLYKEYLYFRVNMYTTARTTSIFAFVLVATTVLITFATSNSYTHHHHIQPTSTRSSPIWEHPEPLPPGLGGVVLFWRSEFRRESPNVQILHANFSKPSAENAARFGLPMSGWTLLGSVIQPKSRGRIRLTGSDPLDPFQIEAIHMDSQDDLKAAMACVKLGKHTYWFLLLQTFQKLLDMRVDTYTNANL